MIATPITPDLVRGAVELEPTDRGLLPHRLPSWARAQCADPQLTAAEARPSGVRLALRTRASVIELETLRTTTVHHGLGPRPAGLYDLVVDGVPTDRREGAGGDVVTIDLATGAATTDPGAPGTVRFAGLPDQDKDVEIWLPWNEVTRLVALRTDAPVAPVAPVPPGARVWCHHGSSISAGSNAAGPTGTWPAVAARRGGLELVNLGLAGSALLDPSTARTMRDTPADLISLKLGINVVNADLMRLRAFGPAVHGVLDTIRDGHPTTPLLVVSPLYCAIHEDTPGPGAFDPEALARGEVSFRATGDPEEVRAGKLTLRVVRAELERIVAERAAGDPHLHHLDGQVLYGEADAATFPLPDGLHPDAATHEVIGRRFAEHVLAAGGPFEDIAGRHAT
ncbi:SGNH/GDSL hydrolase family protein [Actinomycetospora soli]|uniref:SGNH/GDSL hydrolase family protein n=1 Tax=Actinomycetospora soli TaxID=2893887 RepID=UPI001E32AB8A|nr:SGNH/GDSL hydrolase family protein [Actinomycetospora soli]MCD2190248.1 GDSL-type esterase/lipase family protein [Actinomycetospora soli]